MPISRARSSHISFPLICFFPAEALGGGEEGARGWGNRGWRRSTHALASYPRQPLVAPGFNPKIAREEGRVQGLDYTRYIDTNNLK